MHLHLYFARTRLIRLHIGGDNSGASQPHKHLQLIPTGEDGPPIEKVARTTAIETAGPLTLLYPHVYHLLIYPLQNAHSLYNISPTPTTSVDSPPTSQQPLPTNKNPSSPAPSFPSSTWPSLLTATTPQAATEIAVSRSHITSSSLSNIFTSFLARQRHILCVRRVTT